MNILQLRMPGSLKGPVMPSPATTSKLDAVKAVLRLLNDAGIMPGSFAAKDLFHLAFEAIQSGGWWGSFGFHLRFLTGRITIHIVIRGAP
ncbi:hypothetical protein L916_06761 [Phytophthora nicotianae]|uniref:Uncharacterized protein n=1 Tax=Phytophthora nicotianae TaxID=4792 RepID=W2J7R9_PHYNI|nr:hypothetical protein L916_06761 [Phytophthora nicotianae]